MIPASLYLGFSAAIIWVGQGTYLTATARSHAEDCHLHEVSVIGYFNGEFWGVFASTQIFGNLISLALLRNGEEERSVTGTSLLYVVFLAFMVLGVILMCFLSRIDDKEESIVIERPSLVSRLKSVISPILETRLQLIVPLLAYSGLQQAFVWAEFTKHIVTPTIGVSGVGAAMAVYGAADATISLTAGRLTSGLSSITAITLFGAFLQTLVLLWILLANYATTGALGYAYTLVMSALWGAGNGVFNTQLNALIGILFQHYTEAAFSQLKVWQSASTALVFFVSPHMTFQAVILVLLVAIFFSLAGLLFLSLCFLRASSSAPYQYLRAS